MNLEFKEAERRTTLAFINPKVSTDTIFINDNALEKNICLFETNIELILEHESLHLAILNTVGETESRALDNIPEIFERLKPFW